MLTGPCSLQSKQYHFRIPYHSVLVRVLESGQPKDYAFGVCCFSAKHATLRDKNKDRLAENIITFGFLYLTDLNDGDKC